MFAKIKIGGARTKAVATVPSSAVFSINGAPFVLIEESHAHFRRRAVTIGQEVDGMTLVESASSRVTKSSLTGRCCSIIP